MKRIAPFAILFAFGLLDGCERGSAPGPSPAPPPAAGGTARSSIPSTPPAAPATPPAPAASTPPPAPAAPAGPVAHPALLDPSRAAEKAPDQFRVKLATTKGEITIEVNREWSPNGADRFYNLVKIGYFTDVAFFRVINRFMAQFGISGDPRVGAKWREATIPDDEVRQSNQRGYLTFAKTGRPDSRSTQLFLNLVDNTDLDSQGFSPIGRVVAGMEAVDALYDGYGEGAPGGSGPSQPRIQAQGNEYLRRGFPELDSINSASIAP